MVTENGAGEAKHGVIILRPMPWSEDPAEIKAWMIELWESDGYRAECECPHRVKMLQSWHVPGPDAGNGVGEAWAAGELAGLTMWRAAMRAPTDELGHVHGCQGRKLGD